MSGTEASTPAATSGRAGAGTAAALPWGEGRRFAVATVAMAAAFAVAPHVGIYPVFLLSLIHI